MCVISSLSLEKFERGAICFVDVKHKRAHFRTIDEIQLNRIAYKDYGWKSVCFRECVWEAKAKKNRQIRCECRHDVSRSFSSKSVIFY